MWKHLTHPNIVPLLGVTTDPFQLISEWMPGGDLSSHIMRNPGVDLLGLVGVPPVVFIPRLPRSQVVRRYQGSLLPPLPQYSSW